MESPLPSQPPAMVTLSGLGVSPGIALGPALVFRPVRDAMLAAADTPVADAATEIACVNAALAQAAAELRGLAEQVSREVGAEEAGIFEAQAMMLEDPTIAERVQQVVEGERRSGAAALAQATEEQAQALAALPDPLWQARAADVRDATRRAVRYLLPPDTRDDLAQLLARAGRPVIVIAEDLAPSDTAQMRRETVLGICTVGGGPTAHAAILARALRIPAVAGLGEMLFTAVAEGDLLALDGTTGVVHVRPDGATAAAIQARMAAAQGYDQAMQMEAQAWKTRPGRTRDGAAVAILANVGSVAEAQAAAEWGAEGIGLLRTEFLFAGRSTLPDEHEQAALYMAIIAAFHREGAPIVVRTLDAGNDKPLPALAAYTRELPTESNPALGVRGFRLHTAFPALLEAQMRGLIRAAASTGAMVHVMLPMVATVEEVRRARQALRGAEATLAAEGVQAPAPLPLGIMVETPAAALHADALAQEAEFFSIGTNDLAQYVMASDRLNSRLAGMVDARQPAVLRAISQVATAARRAGRMVAVCGEMAADPRLAALLVGLGVEELSMSPPGIPAVKRALADHSLEELHTLAEQALAAATLADVEHVLQM